MQPFGLNHARAKASRIVRDVQRVLRLIDAAINKMGRHAENLKGIIDDLKLIFRLVRAWANGQYKDISLEAVIILIGAIIYFLMPIDAIPDVIPVIGYMDDVTVIVLALATVKGEIDRYRTWEESQKAQEKQD